MSDDDATTAHAPRDDSASIRRVAEIAAAVGAWRIRDRALALAERLAAARVYVAVVGQVKRGKSSLLNGIIGQRLLPTDLAPATAVPTVVRHGASPQARVHFVNGDTREILRSQVAEYVGEAANPDNVKRVDTVEVFVAHPMLEDGLCLVDTPGLGSIVRGAGATTRRFIPQIDAAIVVLGVDPPLSADELDLVAHLSASVRTVLGVLNKADRFPDAARRAARAYAANAIASRIGRPIEILEVSATEQLAHSGPARDWPRLMAALARLTTTERPALIGDSLARGAWRIVDECLTEISELARAAYAPVADAEDRLERLQSLIAGTAFDSLSIRHLVAREVRRTSASIEASREQFITQSLPGASYELRRAVERYSRSDADALRAYARLIVSQMARRELEEWGRREAARASAAEDTARRDFMRAAYTLLESARLLRADASTLEGAGFEGLGLAPAGSMDPAQAPLARALRAVEDTLGKPVPARSLGVTRRIYDRLRSSESRRREIATEADAALRRLFDAGARAIERSLVEHIETIGGAIEDALHQVVAEAFERADRAVAIARAARDRSAPGARRELRRLAAWRRELEAMRAPAAPSVASGYARGDAP